MAYPIGFQKQSMGHPSPIGLAAVGWDEAAKENSRLMGS